MSDAVATAFARPVIDGEPHPLTENLIKGMVELLTTMFRGNEVAVFVRRPNPEEFNGWLLASDTIEVAGGHGQVTVGGQNLLFNDGRFYDPFAFDADGSFTYTVNADRSVTFIRQATKRGETDKPTSFVPVRPPLQKPSSQSG